MSRLLKRMMQRFPTTEQELVQYKSGVNDLSPARASCLELGPIARIRDPEFERINKIWERTRATHFNRILKQTHPEYGGDKIVGKTMNAGRLRRNGVLFCYYFIKRFKPDIVLELGTSFGWASLHMLLALQQNEKGHLHTCEASPIRVEIARQIFEEAGFQRCTIHQGRFEDTLPEVAAELDHVDFVLDDGDHRFEAMMRTFKVIFPKLSAHGVMVFDDIDWSEGMRRAWAEIREAAEVAYSAQVFGSLGVIGKGEVSG